MGAPGLPPEARIRTLAVFFVAALPPMCDRGGGYEPVYGVDSGAASDGEADLPPHIAAGDALSDEGWDRSSAADVCAVWTRARAARSEGAWSGRADECRTGDNAVGRAYALHEVNLTRWLAGLPDRVETDPDLDYATQQCAVMMHGQGALSHTPPGDWACFTSRGAVAAEASLLASAPAVAAVDLYLIDKGHPDTLGHRRWLLSNTLETTGIGTTNQFSCLWVVDGSGEDAGLPWVAWPPPGPIPAELLRPSELSSLGLDDTGWTVQSDAFDLSGGTARVWEDGVERPVQTWDLAPWVGSRSALAFAPQGWESRAGAVYDVRIQGGGTTIEYRVEPTDCGATSAR